MDNLTLKVVGLGHTVSIDISPSATVRDLQKEVESQTSLPAAYQRLIFRGKKLDDDSRVLGQDNDGLGIEHRTRLMLLHNEFFAADKKGIDAINAQLSGIDDLEKKIKEGSLQHKVVDELITRICCNLDAVDTNGSERLRAMRKDAIRKAESLAN
uniref:Ubiquitin-like domain-containing protein n=1 Tax=Helicotheca tamesis TaxID=374047 RepID=A0A7S2H4E9_9STRA|mmetsp:Transcript_15159/g.20669  ORF Transcript_15159/g.20669 Transcript_15159/m.20669 type:complete len:155 (+) Transcript_15159:74-538(+)|eukprot:CAMPEP_0185725278 /NCGR_PEP_ID=MMETSP1171-20130828/1573_1 /TAXON_ID=374046 /ORGANISM="Helicotheca tamensis, Strain CCMP826" /LENGTH=154 /DNA_ID=CAMNT_0028393361 /DNA_START=34 /DNA_END=498 /DNA_ORIENTATION=-